MSASAMSLQDMRDFVRDALDTDALDLPDALLDRYIIDGSNRVDSHSSNWTFRSIDYTFSAAAETQAYDIRSASRVSGITYPVERIVDVRGRNWSYLPADHQAMRTAWASATAVSGTPNHFTLWGDSLYLWPTPSVTHDVSITGYRHGIDWVGAGGAPDFPDEFHELIAWWALNRAYAREGDPQTADFYRGEFAVALAERAKPWIAGLTAQPLILGGGSRPAKFRTQSALGPLVYPWE